MTSLSSRCRGTARSQRIFDRLVTICYPRSFRDRYGDQMRQVFRDRLRELEPRDGELRALWRRTLYDLAVSGLRVRLRALVTLGSWGAPSTRRLGTTPRQNGDPMVITFLYDLRYAVRGLLRSPAFALVTLVTLALGIGGNTAIFSVVNGVLLNSLPFPDADRLVAIRGTLRGQIWWSESPANLRAFRERNRTLDGVAYSQIQRLTLSGDGDPEQVVAARVSANFLDVLGTPPVIGRGFRLGEDALGAQRTAVLTHGFWRRRFDGDTAVIGTTVSLDGEPHLVIGVAPPSYRNGFTGNHDLLVPRFITETDFAARGRSLQAIGRLAAGNTLVQAEADLNRISRQLEREATVAMVGWGVSLVPLHDQVVGSVRSVLWLLLGAVGFVLLVACANISNLMLARGASRQREISLRLALGSGRLRVFRQILTETTIVAVLGGVLGLIIAVWGTELLLSIDPGGLPRIDEIAVDTRVLAFTAAISVLAGLLFGLVPAVRASGAALHGMLRDASSTDSERRVAQGRWLVAVELALVFVLLVGAGLTLRSFIALRAVDTGFVVENRLTFQIALPTVNYPARSDAARFFEQLDRELTMLPSVVSVGAVSNLPLTGPGWTGYHLIVGRPPPAPGEEPIGGMEGVDDGYFRTMGLAVLRGRTFARRDHADAKPVAVVNDVMARLFWPAEDPLGHQVSLGPAGTVSIPREIVGVVTSVRYGLDADPRPRVYMPMTQLPLTSHSRYIVVATSGQPEELISPVRAALHRIDAALSLARAQSMQSVLDGSIAQPRLQTTLLGVFAVLALMLGAVGVYGVVSYSVSRRRREVGIRMALGAHRREVIRLVILDALRPVILGIAVGLVGATGLMRVMSSLVFEGARRDVWTLGTIPILLIAVAVLASYVPARRAARIDVAKTLRAE